MQELLLQVSLATNPPPARSSWSGVSCRMVWASRVNLFRAGLILFIVIVLGDGSKTPSHGRSECRSRTTDSMIAAVEPGSTLVPQLPPNRPSYPVVPRHQVCDVTAGRHTCAPRFAGGDTSV